LRKQRLPERTRGGDRDYIRVPPYAAILGIATPGAGAIPAGGP